MIKIVPAAYAPLLLCICTVTTACSSSSADSPANAGGSGQSQGGENSAGESEGGAPNARGDAGEGGVDSSAAGDASIGGTSAGGSSAGTPNGGSGSVTPTTSPCAYTVSGGQTFPESDAMYICTVNSRVYQKGGKGEFNALIGAGFSTANGDTSTFACSVDSSTAPKAGDTWTLDKDDHPGNCDLSFSREQVATLWHATSSPMSGTITIKFNQVTAKNGMYNPEDVYYLYDLTITATLEGQTEGATEVTVSSRFVNMALPLGA